MMSRYFTWFPNWLVLGEPNIYHDSGVFFKKWEDCGRNLHQNWWV